MKKLMTMAFAMGLAAAGFAAMNDALISFSTRGPDKYADGTVALDGECYALIWTANGSTFAGLKADGTPVAATDQLLLVGPVAKDGACPNVLFQLPADKADALEGKGTYAVYLLDTRVKAEDGSVALAPFKGKLALANGVAAVSEATEVAADGVAAAAPLAAAAVNGAQIATQTLVDAPVITGIKVAGAKVKVTVAGLSPIATYKVVAGDSPAVVGTEVEAKVEGDTFEFAKPQGKFFKIVGARNFK